MPPLPHTPYGSCAHCSYGDSPCYNWNWHYPLGTDCHYTGGVTDILGGIPVVAAGVVVVAAGAVLHYPYTSSEAKLK